MSARLRATPWFRSAEEEAEARHARCQRINYPPPFLSYWYGLDPAMVMPLPESVWYLVANFDIPLYGPGITE